MTTRDEAIEQAARVYDAILADPEQRAAILAHRRATETPAPAAPPAVTTAGVGSHARRRSA